MRSAFLAAYQLSGGPDWLDADRFDVEATAPGVPDSPRGTFPSPLLAMLRSLLEERFQLQTHFEAKELPVFALVLARRDGTLGPRLRRRTVDCCRCGYRAGGRVRRVRKRVFRQLRPH